MPLAPNGLKEKPIGASSDSVELSTRTESEVMRVPPYYSNVPNGPEVHHVFSDCLVGQRIPFPRRRSGTNGHPLCKECAAMPFL